MKTAVLKIEKVSKDFSGLQVLNRIDIEIYEGERHAIIGPNGAGKSTLFNIITGLHRPTSGRLFFLGKDITGKSIQKIARLGICRSFQVINVFPEMTVLENVRNAVVSKFNRRFNWISLLNSDEEIIKEGNRILELCELNHVKDTLASELSYGLQRKLELALAIAPDPILILLDEPTAGLNTDETKNAIKLIRQVTEGKTLVIIEHDMEVVFSLADRITVLSYGKTLAIGTPDEIRMSKEVKGAYLGRE
jgi:branched-chain amino acid transport system ATP-binding protein